MQDIESRMIARQFGREIESKSVDMHLLYPVPQAVGDQLQRPWMQQIQAVTSTGEIKIEPGIFRVQPVIGGIIDTAETERGAQMISFSGVIVNHIENHFQTSRVQAAHHRFELGDLLAHLPTAGILSMRSEKADRVVAPIISKAVIDQEFI